MTLIYVHGVKVRDPRHGVELQKPFFRWLGPKLSRNGAPPDYNPVFWGDAAAKFRWELDSRPRTKLLRQGEGTVFGGIGSLRAAGADTPLDNPGVPVMPGPVLGSAGTDRQEAPPLSAVPLARRPDFLADLYLAVLGAKGRTDPLAEEPRLAALADAAAQAAAQWDRLVAGEPTEEKRAAKLLEEVDPSLATGKLLRQGGVDDFLTRAGETLRRAATWPADALGTVFAELRPTAHEFVAYFVGDVFTYLNQREVAGRPGEIPTRVLGALKSANAHKKQTREPIVVITHSMGGQLFYDAMTYFSRSDPELSDLVVDHWITCGSQVSFFAELALLKGQADVAKPKKLARPSNVAAWTNFYDPNDVVGFVMQPVFDGVTDAEYDTGYGLVLAHTGFLARPSFFQEIANRL